MTESSKFRASESKIEGHVAGGEKSIGGAPIVDKNANEVQQRLNQRDAIKAFRLTRDPANSFVIDMGEGQSVTDKRPIRPMTSAGGPTLGEHGAFASDSNKNMTGVNIEAERNLQAVNDLLKTLSKSDSLTDKLARQFHVEPSEIIASGPQVDSSIKSDATNARELKDKIQTPKEKIAETAESKASALIMLRVNYTAEAAKHPHDQAHAAPSKKDDIKVEAFNPFDEKSRRHAAEQLHDITDAWTPGNIDQKEVSDLGIEKVRVADLKNSNAATQVLDHALAEARLDPKHYNCNDYVMMFVTSQESLAKLEEEIKKHTNASVTDSPEGFLKKHDYNPINSNPLKDGDVIVIHGPRGAHSAVICVDPVTHETYTMQKPNPTEMPVKLSLDQFCRAENVANAFVEVYRK